MSMTICCGRDESVLWVNKGRVRLNFAELHKDDEAEENHRVLWILSTLSSHPSRAPVKFRNIAPLQMPLDVIINEVRIGPTRERPPNQTAQSPARNL
jgi:hypothetical protein